MDTTPLGSWNDGAAKRAIVDFVTAAAVAGSPGFVAPMDRVAVFDNDGTLWVEKPAPVQMAFVLGKLAARLEADPSLARERPYRALVDRDASYFHALNEQDPDAVASMVDAIGSAWEGTTLAQYEAEAARHLESWRHERFGVPYSGLVYQPMLELFDYLGAHGWRLFVCSGGGRDFMRVICEDTWGLPRENVIGSAPEFAWRDGVPVRRAVLHGPVAIGPGKPEYVLARTGRLPRFAAGNDDVDVELLASAQFALLVLHDDDEREYAYTEGAERAHATARREGWTTVSVKDDWKTVLKERSDEEAPE
ncbi:haloacid dehalogenase-like hydrolase [Streptomyces sp. SLBN-118]|uniref:HAD family hydrolase n=1 Tax=Streptomyces sp. SLBN-118 TaxID=2768454 RepID=UPI00114E333F|nr:HAD family hydrolase [Streptomyces sp. SLBN-118]TQK50633.1 haloacid dehalogenase-like hydrolase [Streptomyces sp. SLBN-118]